MANLVRRGSVNTLDPWRVMDEMERHMWDWMGTPLGLTPMNRLFGEAGAYVPPVNVCETPDEVLVIASLPGIDAANVNVQIQNGAVTLTGEQKPVYAPDKDLEVTEHIAGIREYGRFSFTFSLPCEVEGERAQASYQEGILRIRFPKAQRAKPLRIAVNVANEQQPIEGEQQKHIEGAENGGK